MAGRRGMQRPTTYEMRKRREHGETTRERIQTTQLVIRLQDHALGKNQMTKSEVRASMVLLRKTLPDLQAIEMVVDAEVTQKVVSAEPLTEEQWMETYGNGSSAIN